jgi:hypothetical protein
MAAPRLSSSAARALPFIESGVSRGLSTTQIQTELSAGGIGVRRTDLLEAVRAVRGAELAADRLKSVRSDYRPDPSRLPQAVTRQLREYSFRVRVQGYNPETGNPESRYFNVSTNELMTREDIESVALGYSVDTDVYLPFEPEQVDLVSATRR